MSFLFLVLIGVGLGLLALITWSVTAGIRNSHRRQERLEIAFERAQYVRQTGSGIQGTPYSLYGQHFLQSDSDRISS